MKWPLLPLLALCALCWCTSPHVADNSSSETTNGATLSGLIVDATGAPVEGARIALSRRDSVQEYIFAVLDSTKSDSDGAFCFTRIPPGEYFVVGRKGPDVSLSAAMYLDEGNARILDPDTLRRECVVTARIAMETSFPLALRLHETPFLAMADTSGSIGLCGLAAGSFVYEAIASHADDPWTAIIDRRRIELSPGDSLDLGALATALFMDGADTVVLDDFEDGDERHCNNQRWWAYNEQRETNSSIEHDFAFVLPDTTRCAWLAYTFREDSPAFCGIGVHLGYRRGEFISRSYDFSCLSAISLRAKGSGHLLKIELISHIGRKLSIPVDTLRREWTAYRIDIDSAIVAAGASARSAWDETAPFVSWFTFYLTQGEGAQGGEFFADDIIFSFDE